MTTCRAPSRGWVGPDPVAQAPATPKGRRVALRLAATLGLPQAFLRPAPSERAARALRATRRTTATRPAEAVIFLVPLVGPHHVTDWTTVTDRLRMTVQSFLDQDDPRWRAVICSQTAPPLPDDPRITHLPFDDSRPGNDKWRKLAALADYLPQIAADTAYVMTFDADDLLARDAVAEMLGRQASGGYLVEAGYVLDHGTGTIALAERPSVAAPLRKAFWKLCGSCVALRHDPEVPQSTAFLKAMTAHEHRMFPHLAALAGLRLAPLTPPAVLYVLNHGENFGARRGRVSFKTRFVQRFALDEHDRAAALERFPDA